MNKKRKLRIFLLSMRRNYKYMTVQTMIEHDLVNKCLETLGMSLTSKEVEKLSTQAIFAKMAERMRYLPTIKNLINTAMVEERSLLLKRVKQELKGE